MTRSEQFREVLVTLHRKKSGDYGNAWKKRGEVLSILANIARKVDRLEVVVEKQVLETGESLVDTLADLLVYCVKYQTYLADQDESVAAGLGLGAATKPYSDGVAGFEHLLSRVSFEGLDRNSDSQAIQRVVNAFAALEAHFSAMRPTDSVLGRLGAATNLIRYTVEALGQVAESQPSAWQQFVHSQP